MKRAASVSLCLVLLLWSVPAASQGPGLFVRPDCTTITAPVTGQTWCFDATAQLPKVWNGSAFVQSPPVAALSTGTYAVRNLVGQNDASTPNTKYGFSSDSVSFLNISTGQSVGVTPVATITVDVTAQGVNGRDQAGAFSANSWVHLYFTLFPGSGVHGLASATAPPTGPVLQGGDTHWAYVGAIRFNASSQLVSTYIRGSWVTIRNLGTDQFVLTSGSAVVETAVSLTATVPPNALAWRGILNARAANAAPPTANQLKIYNDTGNTGYTFYLDTFTQVANLSIEVISEVTMPHLGQNVYYLWLTNADTRNAFLYINGYQVPNGGE